MREYTLKINNNSYVVRLDRVSDEEVVAKVNGVRHVVAITDIKNIASKRKRQTPLDPVSPAPTPAVSSSLASGNNGGGAGAVGLICSPIPGHILEIVVRVGDKVLEGQKLLVLEAMKMENVITAHQAGVVKKILVRTGDAVNHGQSMVEIG